MILFCSCEMEFHCCQGHFDFSQSLFFFINHESEKATDLYVIVQVWPETALLVLREFVET